MIRIVESHFVKSAVKAADFPASAYRDIAFAGKSNVGKSSLINTILNRKAIAKISSTPGKTKLINFFEIRFKQEEDMNGFVNFVDLPGYGYAKVSKIERNKWRLMLEDFFRYREQLKSVLLLVDIRHKADPKDVLMIEMLRKSKIDFAVVATKSDKIAKSKIQATISKLKKELNIVDIKMLPFSSLKKTGKENLLAWIEEQIL